VIRSLMSACIAGALVVGCVSIDPGLPTAAPSLPIPTGVETLPPIPQTQEPATSAPTDDPTLPPESTPSIEPSVAPSEQPTDGPLPTAQSTPGGVENYGAATPLINDGFNDPTSGWGVGTNDGGSVAYGDGTLEIATATEGAWEWTRIMTGSTDNAVHVETLWEPTGSGYQGLLCANSDDELWGAEANENGNYRFIRLDAEGAHVLAEGQIEELAVSEFGNARLAVDCAGTGAGTFKMQISSAGTNVGTEWFAEPGEGPESFDRVGIYAESTGHPYSLSVDFVLAFGGDGDTSMSPEAVELMTHIPADWQPDCFDAFASYYATGWQADILCQLFDGRSDYAEYTTFDTKANMDAYFNYVLGKWPLPAPSESCESGPFQGGYTIGGEPAGQLLCTEHVTGTQLVWTHDDLLIFSQLIDNDGSYPDMYADWLIAGPN